MSATIPLVLASATISLYPADVFGNAILTYPVWIGARAEGVTLDAEIQEVESTPSGAETDEYEQVSESHEINIERIWVLPKGPNGNPGGVLGRDYELPRGKFVMIIYGEDKLRTGIYHQRTYYYVTPKRYGLRSQGIMEFGANQVFRARYFEATGGVNGQPVMPQVFAGGDQPLLFLHDGPLADNVYLLGEYIFPSAVRVTKAKGVALASQVTATELTLEIDGVLTEQVIVLPVGYEGEEVSFEIEDLNLIVNAYRKIRWKTTLAPASGGDQALSVSVTVNVDHV